MLASELATTTQNVCNFVNPWRSRVQAVTNLDLPAFPIVSGDTGYKPYFTRYSNYIFKSTGVELNSIQTQKFFYHCSFVNRVHDISLQQVKILLKKVRSRRRNWVLWKLRTLRKTDWRLNFTQENFLTFVFKTNKVKWRLRQND